MKLQDVLYEINRQSIIQSNASEIYDQDTCEVLAFDCILDYYTVTHPDSEVLHLYSKRMVEEEWMIISELFTDYVSDQIRLNVEDDILFLLEEFYQRFFLSHNLL